MRQSAGCQHGAGRVVAEILQRDAKAFRPGTMVAAEALGQAGAAGGEADVEGGLGLGRWLPCRRAGRQAGSDAFPQPGRPVGVGNRRAAAAADGAQKIHQLCQQVLPGIQQPGGGRVLPVQGPGRSLDPGVQGRKVEGAACGRMGVEGQGRPARAVGGPVGEQAVHQPLIRLRSGWRVTCPAGGGGWPPAVWARSGTGWRTARPAAGGWSLHRRGRPVWWYRIGV